MEMNFLPGKRQKNANESTSSMRKSCSLRHEKVMYLRMNGIHSFFAVALVSWVVEGGQGVTLPNVRF